MGSITAATEANKKVQRHLAPYYRGRIDGVFGPKTYTAMYCVAAGRNFGAGAVLRGQQAAIEFPKAGIVTPLRLCHFLAQAAHETGGFRYSQEIWGPTPAQKKYDTRTDLGNTPALDGDGERYKGRGDFEITGHANYAEYGEALDLDLVDHPELAATPQNSVRIAVLYWSKHHLNDKADRDDIVGITRSINGGLNGLSDRTSRLIALKRAFGL
jgi:putative chitinase